MVQCPSANTEDVDQTQFFVDGSINWDAHRIGWAVAGGCTVLTILISSISIFQHCRNYTKPNEQRQILRILYMPPFFAIISFLSYRFFREYTYYSLVVAAYEAIALGAFLMLIIEYVAGTAHGHDPEKAIERKGKRPVPFPFCFWRYRPSKAYFLYTIKWTVLQYIFVRIAGSIAGIICQAFNVLCESEGFNFHFASVYIESILFASISIALYSLLWFYGLMKDELATKRPFAKFLCIKLIVMLTFYQTYLFDALEGRVIHATEFWTATNIADGLNALATCIEMVLFSGLMLWAYRAAEYKSTTGPTSIWRPLWDSINFSDFIRETVAATRYYLEAYRKRKADKSKSKSKIPPVSRVDNVDKPIRPTPSAEFLRISSNDGPTLPS
ncbi:DUF300-domain-containing protein [Pluteus cervinus]|uniref:DUF300-domain-containing protein n=1 Tax=Pluteus cervinus TaxID=181527 RepID=A0ACD3B2M9_9AGAR|nr:DUF300-domain-containing protein [Pluteus cervinus]